MIKKLLFIGFSFLVVNMASADSSLDAALENIKNFHARFIQTEGSNDQFTKKKSNGEIWVSVPNRFRWHAKGEDEQIVVADSKNLWIYDIPLKQIAVYDQMQALINSPAILLSNPSQLSDAFTVEFMHENQKGRWYKLTPKTNSFLFDEVIFLIRNKRIRELAMIQFDDNSETRLKLQYKSYNKAIEDEIFQFIPLDGIDVIAQ